MKLFCLRFICTKDNNLLLDKSKRIIFRFLSMGEFEFILIKYERDLLAKIHHPFIVNMHYSFQDSQNLYIVLDLLSGGDLRYHLSQNKKFTEEQTSN